MANITRHETPTQQVVAKATAEYEVIDSAGRKFKLRKPGFLAQFRLVELVGESAKNDVYMRMILPLVYIAAIDGDAVAMPANKLQLEALIQRVEEHGFSAVAEGLMAHFGSQDAEADKDRLKK